SRQTDEVENALIMDKLKHVPPARQLWGRIASCWADCIGPRRERGRLQTGLQDTILPHLACVLMLVSALAAADDWPAHGGDPGGQRFSMLKEINRENVKSLKVAWTYRTGDAYQPKNSRGTAFEATPLYVDGTLYLSTPLGRVIALDPVSGEQVWSYDGKVDRDKGYGDFANRGVLMWRSPQGQVRIIIATVEARLIEVDAAKG